jgi:hypothetical protein
MALDPKNWSQFEDSGIKRAAYLMPMRRQAIRRNDGINPVVFEDPDAPKEEIARSIVKERKGNDCGSEHSEQSVRRMSECAADSSRQSSSTRGVL